MKRNIRTFRVYSLIWVLLLLIPRSVSAQNRFEKGDGIYRYGIPPALTFLVGHAGLYWHWEGENPEDDTTHRTIESLGSIWWWEWSEQGPTVTNYHDFLTGKGADAGVFTRSNIDWKKRNKIVKTAYDQVEAGAHYSFVKGYKNPAGNPRSFRCDGLVEYCYEVAYGEPWEPGNNKGIVENDTWVTLWPFKQKGQMTPETPKLEEIAFHKEGKIEEGKAITPEENVKYESGEYHTKGTVNIQFYASDGDKGSGLTRGELWLGEPGVGKLIGEIDADVEIDTTYVFPSFDTTTVDNGEYNLIAKAFDQAGNYATVSVPVVIDNEVSYQANWQGYALKLTLSKPYSGEIKYWVKADITLDTQVDPWEEHAATLSTQDTVDCHPDWGDKEYQSNDDNALLLTHDLKVKMPAGYTCQSKKEYFTHRLIVKNKADGGGPAGTPTTHFIGWNSGAKQNVTVQDNLPPNPGDGKIVAGAIIWTGIGHSGEFKRVSSPGYDPTGSMNWLNAWNNRTTSELTWQSGTGNFGWSQGPGYNYEGKHWWNFAVSQEYRSGFINVGSYKLLRISNLSHFYSSIDQGWPTTLPSLVGSVVFYDSGNNETDSFDFSVPYGTSFTPSVGKVPLSATKFRIFAELSPTANAFQQQGWCDARFVSGAIPWANPQIYGFLWGTANGSSDPAIQGTLQGGTWTYTHNFGVPMNTGEVTTKSSGSVTPAYTWSEGNTKLTTMVSFTATAQEMTKIRVEVKEAKQ